MKIKKLTIENFRGIKRLELDLCGPNEKPHDMVVLAGPNGCGKTSVLEACAILLGKTELLPEKDERDLYEVYRGAESCELSAVIDEDGKETIFNKKLEQGKSPGKYKKDDRQLEYFPSWRAPKLVGSVSVSVNGGKGKTDKRMENSLANLKQTIVDLTASQAFETSAAAPELSGELNQILDRLNSAWKLFFPGHKESFKADAVKHAMGKKFDLFLSGRNKSLIPIDSLSSGEIEILSLIGRIARKETENGIILIDEPELHLHPAWHRVILIALQKVLSGSQLIVATHSPQVIGSIEPALIRLLHKKGTDTKIEIPMSSYGLDSNRVLEELMGADERLTDIKKKIHKVFVLIGDKKLDEAKKQIKSLKNILPDEPELTRAEAMILRKETIGK